MSARLVLILFLATVTTVARVTAQGDNAPIVRVRAAYQEYDPFVPWQKRPPEVRAGLGIVIDDAHVLTTEGLVRNHTLIEIQLARSGEKIAATLVKADPQVNLALLHIADAPQLATLPHPTLGGAVPVRSAIEIVQIDKTSEIQRGDGQIVKALVDSLPNVPFSALLGDVLTDLNVDGEGAAVFHDNKLAGVMLNYSRSTRTGKMLPSTFISRFIQDAKSTPYEGFASAGFTWQPLVDPTKRTYLGVDAAPGGVQILSCLPETGASAVLKPNDVILKWDGHEVDKLGYYTDEDYGRLLFPHLIKGRRSPTDIVAVTIVRAGETQDVQVPLSCRNEAHDLIPENVTGAPRAYLVDGGLVIRELTGRMLRAYGSQWQTRVDPRLAHLYLMRQYAPERPGDRVVLLSSVLPDPINIGYQHFRNQIIEKVNQQPIRNIQDVFRIVDTTGCIKSISLRAIGVDIVLDQDELAIANQRISDQYRLPTLQRTVD